MASRTHRAPVIDRLSQARQQLAAVNVMIGRHYMGCSRCPLAGGDVAKRYDTGWELAKAQARAQAAVRRLSEPAPGAPVQDTLW